MVRGRKSGETEDSPAKRDAAVPENKPADGRIIYFRILTRGRTREPWLYFPGEDHGARRPSNEPPPELSEQRRRAMSGPRRPTLRRRCASLSSVPDPSQFAIVTPFSSVVTTVPRATIRSRFQPYPSSAYRKVNPSGVGRGSILEEGRLGKIQRFSVRLVVNQPRATRRRRMDVHLGPSSQPPLGAVADAS